MVNSLTNIIKKYEPAAGFSGGNVIFALFAGKAAFTLNLIGFIFVVACIYMRKHAIQNKVSKHQPLAIDAISKWAAGGFALISIWFFNEQTIGNTTQAYFSVAALFAFAMASWNFANLIESPESQLHTTLSLFKRGDFYIAIGILAITILSVIEGGNTLTGQIAIGLNITLAILGMIFSIRSKLKQRRTTSVKGMICFALTYVVNIIANGSANYWLLLAYVIILFAYISVILQVTDQDD